MSNKTKCRGSAAVEMALVTIPLIFFLVSTIELGRALWSYHTLAATIKKGVRFVVVHGARCVDASSACKATIGDTVQVITRTGVGLDAAQMQLTFIAGGQIHTCSSAASCAGDETVWPPSHYNAAGMAASISGNYTFRSILGFLWPGQMGNSFGLSAKSTETIQF
jgi:hypothetical protein